MFFACGIWCLADVSSVSPSSELPGFCGGQQSEDSQRLESCSSKNWHPQYRVVGGFAGDVQHPTLSAAPSSES